MIGGISYFHSYAYDLLATNERRSRVRARRTAAGSVSRQGKRGLGFEATTTLERTLDEVIPWIGRAIEAGTI